MKKTILSTAAAIAIALGVTAVSEPAHAATAEAPPDQNWSFEGPFGTFDRAALRRGLQVYADVCSGCHGLRLVAYRALGEIGFSEEEIKAFAARWEVEDGPDEFGDMYMREAEPSDRFVAPFPNEQAARSANGGALPPDLSLITKARKGGADYVHALLTGYEEEPPAGVELMGGMYYNHYFPGNQLAMAPPLFDGLVEYADGTEATTEQMARDVVTFLSWAAEPEMEERKRLGLKVLIFLIVFTALLYALKRKIWSDVH